MRVSARSVVCCDTCGQGNLSPRQLQWGILATAYIHRCGQKEWFPGKEKVLCLLAAPEALVTAAIMAPGPGSQWGRGLPSTCARECVGFLLELSCCYLINGPPHSAGFLAMLLPLTPAGQWRCLVVAEGRQEQQQGPACPPSPSHGGLLSLVAMSWHSPTRTISVKSLN